ncbi:hypothetical protein [Sphingobium lignivorans]|uniref:Uncharacterized protein n=1 Tax=Sphingobium lignivorans TaxID=2735886 RepID=A0ABR6NH44_9SPHN|nr:hypothetical protein [Sphingobium lignivorans]MBB5986600.1 hypothetical protein [Sphingobium lignivorans]
MAAYIEEVPLAAMQAFSQRRDISEDAPPPADSEQIRAAVNGSSLLSFVDGIEGTEKQDILFSIQFAARAASGKHDRFLETPAWYRRYIEVLEQVGWAGEQFVFKAVGEREGGVRMDSEALSVIAAIATGNQLTVLTESIKALRAMADDDGMIDLFEFQASSLLGGNFQIGAVEKSTSGLLSIALGGFYFKSFDNRKKFLFIKWHEKEVNLWTAAQRMVFNPVLYAAAREPIKKRLTDAMDFIDTIELADM